MNNWQIFSYTANIYGRHVYFSENVNISNVLIIRNRTN